MIAFFAPNDLGDSVMALPALAALRNAHPGSVIAVFAKAPVAPLWDELADVEVVRIHGTLDTSRELRRRRVRAAYILPESFRSALIPFLARTPRRVGVAADLRGWMLTDVVPLVGDKETRHRTDDYCAIVDGCDPRTGEASPQRKPIVGIFPGAARGDSKRWPAERFATVAVRLLDLRPDLTFAVFGTVEERSLGDLIRLEAPERIVNRCGETSLPALIRELRRCALVLCNDSGGMHLAAHLGVPVVAVFGVTNPQRTGPRGAPSRIVKPNVRGAEAVASHSPAATRALLRVSPDEVLRHACELLEMMP